MTTPRWTLDADDPLLAEKWDMIVQLQTARFQRQKSSPRAGALYECFLCEIDILKGELYVPVNNQQVCSDCADCAWQMRHGR